MSNLFKKFVSSVLTLSTVLWSVGVAALMPAAVLAAVDCQTLVSGDQIKVVGKPAIYLLDNNLKWRYYENGQTHKSWNAAGEYLFKEVSIDCFKSLSQADSLPFNVYYRQGTYVVSGPNDELYAVQPKGVLAPITLGAAKSLYGATFKSVKLGLAEFASYKKTGASITEAKAHPGMFVKVNGKTWYVDESSTLREFTASGLTANRVNAQYVRTLDASAVAGLSTGAMIDAALPGLTDRNPAGTVVVAPPTGGALQVGLAANNPGGTDLPSGSASNPVLRLTLSAASDVKVTGLTIRKNGYAANTSIAGVDVIDSAGNRHGNVASSLNADSDVTLLFSGNPILVKANVPETVTVRVNLAGGALTANVQFSVQSAASVQSDASSVGGSFPVTGNSFNLQNGGNTLASTTINPAVVLSATVAQTLNVDANNQQEIAKFTIAEVASKEDVKLLKFAIYNNGTSADTDVADVQLVAPNGEVLATAQQVNKAVVFDLSAKPHLIGKGESKTFTVRTKIVNGSARTIQFVVYNDYDVVLVGATSGVSVLPTTNSSAGNTSATSFPAGNVSDYNTATVGTGTVSFNKDASSPSVAVAPGASTVVLSKYFAKPNGEDMELRQVALMISVSTSSPSMFTGSYTLRVNGQSVLTGTPSDVAAQVTSTLSTYPVLKAGVNNYITVEVSMSNSAPNNSTVSTTLGLVQVKRLITNDITSPSTSNVVSNQLTVKAGSLAITNLSTPVPQSLVPGTNGATFANFELNAGASGEDLRVSSIVVDDARSGGAITDIGNLALYKNTGGVLELLAISGNVAVNAASNTFSLVSPIIIKKGEKANLTLKGDVITGSSGSHTYRIGAAARVSVTGNTTGQTVTPSAPTGNGQAMTITASGSLTLSLVSGSNSTPSNDQIVTVGSTNLNVFAFKLTAQNEAIKVTSLKLSASSSAVTSTDVINLKLYKDDATTPFAEAAEMTCVASGGTSTCTYTFAATDNLLPATVQPGAPVTIYVKADIGGTNAAVLGDSFKFSISSTTADIVAKGASSGSAIVPSNTAGIVSGGTSFISPWTVTVTGDTPSAGSSQTQTVAAGTQLARFKVTNNGSGQISLSTTTFTFTDSGSKSTTYTYYLYYSDENSTNYTQNLFTSSTAATSSLNNMNFASTTATTNITVNGGAYRYLTIVVNTAEASATGNSFTVSVSALGNLKYNISETNLGYVGNGDGDLSDIITGLYVDGKPTLGTIVRT